MGLIAVAQHSTYDRCDPEGVLRDPEGVLRNPQELLRERA